MSAGRFLCCVSLALALGSGSARAADPLDAAAGKALFERQWVPAPASTDAADGLGPLFNARSCAACHRKGGAAEVVTAPDGNEDVRGAVVRLTGADGGGDPAYGLQLQTDAVPGLKAEARVTFLPMPDVRLQGAPLAKGVMKHIRLAPSLVGRAQLAEVPAREIEKRADPDDHDRDGISGRVRLLQSPSGPVAGRFGWKAEHATLEDQIAHAFMLDLGLSSPAYPFPFGDCTALQAPCRAVPNGESAKFDGREVSASMISLVAQYLGGLRARNGVADKHGAALFTDTGCATCHVPSLADVQARYVPAFTDLLLHDMGPQLAGGGDRSGVSPSEWRTAPLIGLKAGERKRRYLHDGRAKSVRGAIGWHGGEAERARQRFEALSEADKQRLIGYVEQL